MLTLNLRTLERDGFVTRTVYPTIPPRVDYKLARHSHSLSEPLGVIAQWAITNRQHIVDARVAFDGRSVGAKRVASVLHQYANGDMIERPLNVKPAAE